MYPHRIRLRGPWEVEPLARASGDPRPLPPAGRTTAPGTWQEAGLGDFVGRVLLRRRFGYPGRIDAHERVWLVVTGLGGNAEIAVNGSTLARPLSDPASAAVAAATGQEYDITHLLSSRNELTIDLDLPEIRSGGWGEAALEVRSLAFLRGVQVTRDEQQIHARGVVAGTVDSPLELYLVADRRPLAYATVPAQSDPLPFTLSIPARHEDGSEVRQVRVDLVHGAVIWYVFEATV